MGWGGAGWGGAGWGGAEWGGDTGWAWGFVDISYISSKQYGQYKNWVDMVTVMGNINSEVIWGMSGVVIVNDMSNNDFDWTPRVHNLLENIDLCKHVIGIVSQSRFPNINMYTMTPGINKQVKNINDQIEMSHKKIAAQLRNIHLIMLALLKFHDYSIQICRKILFL